MTQDQFTAGEAYVRPFAAPVVFHRPPRLHWGWVLALNVLTIGLFGNVWLLVQARWAKQVHGRGTAFWWAVAYVLYIPGAFLLGAILGVISAAAHIPFSQLNGALQLIVRAAGLVLYVCASFTLRSELQASPINILLSGFMTFLFGPVYFQYHLFDYGDLGGAETVGLGLSSISPVARAEPVRGIEAEP